MSNSDQVRELHRGNAARDADLAGLHLNAGTYVEHDPHVADGVEGVRGYVEALA